MIWQFLPWPYAAKGIVQHEFDTDHLNIWLTFLFEMDQTVKPSDSKWDVTVDSVQKTVTASAWQDAYTMLLTVSSVSSLPARVLLAYDGPDENLRITWLKQWEPFGPILSLDMTS